jgi:hypothetical protein
MGASLWVEPHLHHSSGWLYYADIWNYFQIAHLTDIGLYQLIYGQTLTTTPGIIVVLAPVWAITHAAGLSAVFIINMPHPTAWLVLGPYEVLLSAPALFAADAVALHMGASRARRMLVCAGEVFALYNVLLWGHPEDALAVAFLLYACLAASERRWPMSGWCLGFAIAFQPFVLLALAPLLFPAGLRRLPSLLARAAAPAAALLFVPLVLNWSVTTSHFLTQPAFPGGGRPTPWLRFAPTIAHSVYSGTAPVEGGPIRLIGLVLAVVIGLWFCRAHRNLSTLIAVVALTMTFRCALESVIAPYYVWPTIAFALLSISVHRWPRTGVVVTICVIVDWMSNFDRQSQWVWWPIMAGLVALVAASWPRRSTCNCELRELRALGPLTQNGTTLREPG